MDGNDFAKYGACSAGAVRQYCGHPGKTKNCQVGVFISYAMEKGYALVNGQLYLPRAWFLEEFKEKCRERSTLEALLFQTKIELATPLICQTVEEGTLSIEWVGCDHGFLKSLPDSVRYFASIKADKLIFTKYIEDTEWKNWTACSTPLSIFCQKRRKRIAAV